jgi:hypothetical protein
MIDQFRRQPNDRDRRVLEGALATEKRHRREEILSSAVALAILLGASILLTVVFRLDDIWFPRRPALWVSLAESFAFFGVVGGIGVLFGLPSMSSWGRTRYFDRQILRMTREGIDTLEAALNGEVEVLRCDATDVVGFEGDGDILWYAFQIAPNRIFFVDADIADSLAEDDEDRFPNTSFEIVRSVDDEDDCLAVHCLGKRLRVSRVLPTSALPDDFEGERTGRLEDFAAAHV